MFINRIIMFLFLFLLSMALCRILTIHQWRKTLQARQRTKEKSKKDNQALRESQEGIRESSSLSKSSFDATMAQAHPLQILLAEDNTINQKVLQHILAQMGYQTDMVGNGLEVLDALERQSYDVILMNIQMPEMDGITTTEQIRNRWPKIKQPRIIALTVNAMKGDRERYLAQGMDDYLSKPIAIEELAKILVESQPLVSKSTSLSLPSFSKSPQDISTLVQEKQGFSNGAIDLQAITKMLGEVAWDVLPDMMAIFFEETPARLATLRQAIVDNDSQKVEQLAHILKGSSSITGATTLSSYSEGLMIMAHQADLTEAQLQMEQIEAEYKKVAENWELIQITFY